MSILLHAASVHTINQPFTGDCFWVIYVLQSIIGRGDIVSKALTCSDVRYLHVQSIHMAAVTHALRVVFKYLT